MYLSAETGEGDWRAEKGDQAERGAEGRDAKGKHTKSISTIYIEILVYTAFLSLRRNLFDGTGGLCGPRCWCWWGARISQEGPKRGLAPAGLRRGGRPEGGWGGGSRGGARMPLGLSIGGQSSHNFIAPLFFSRGGVRSARSGWGNGGSSEPPGPSGTQSAASAPPARG